MYRLRQQTGQSTITYVTLMILVAVAIVWMGPYIIRSTNAKFKIWDDAVEDSFQDPLVETSGGTTIDPCSCHWDEIACGASYAGVQCSELEMLSALVCSPAGCDSAATCARKEGCCTTPGPTGICGEDADPPCPIGEEQYKSECVNPDNQTTHSVYTCEPASHCVPQCTGNIIDNANVCPNDDVGLTENKNWKAVDSCTVDRKCEMKCHSGYIPNGNNTNCVCTPLGGRHFVAVQMDQGWTPGMNNQIKECANDEISTGFHYRGGGGDENIRGFYCTRLIAPGSSLGAKTGIDLPRLSGQDDIVKHCPAQHVLTGLHYYGEGEFIGHILNTDDTTFKIYCRKVNRAVLNSQKTYMRMEVANGPLYSEHPCPEGSVVTGVNFDGKLDNHLNGFYCSPISCG